MPRTRNISRSDWNAANTAKSKENADDSEKENPGRTGRTTRSRAAGRRTVLGAVPAAPTRNTTGSKTNGKGKPPVKAALAKVEKLPLQDITSRFLPAQETENRGHTQPTGFAPPESLVLSPATGGPSNSFPPGLGGVHGPVATAATTSRRVYPSSLPPSSPPSVSSNAAAPSQPQLPVLSRSPTPFVDPLARRLFDGPPAGHALYDPWQEFDHVVPDSDASQSRPRATPRNSDPFGFFALERKLEVEREAEGIGSVKESSLASDKVRPSSPALEYTDASESSLLPPQPPTPHKRSVMPRRDSYAKETYSPSCPDSPSPSKPQQSSSVKRKMANFDTFHDEPEGSTPHVRQQPKRVKKKVDAEVQQANPVLRRSQRGHKEKKKKTQVEEVTGPSGKSRSTKATAVMRRTGSKAAKSQKSAASLPDDDADAEEKRELERQARIAYFRELDDYKVETETVYVI